MSDLRISVVVPTYRRPDLLERCLAALVEQDFPRDGYEVIVCDDGPDAATRQMVERWSERAAGAPLVRYVPVRDTQGPAGARNRGWEIGRGEVIAFTDDDTIPRPGWLRAGWTAMRPGVAAATGRVIVPLPLTEPPTDYQRDIARMEQAEFVTANAFVRREELARVGGFDERFTAAWREDSDLHFKLLETGGTLVKAPEAIVEHPVRDSAWGSGIGNHRKIAFDALLYKKHPKLYRERIRRTPPWNYYGIVLALLVLVVGIVLRNTALWLGAFAAWAVLTGLFFTRRLEGASIAPDHVAEMVWTSIAIPVVAVFWRLVGAFRYRVPFL